MLQPWHYETAFACCCPYVCCCQHACWCHSAQNAQGPCWTCSINNLFGFSFCISQSGYSEPSGPMHINIVLCMVFIANYQLLLSLDVLLPVDHPCHVNALPCIHVQCLQAYCYACPWAKHWPSIAAGYWLLSKLFGSCSQWPDDVVGDRLAFCIFGKKQLWASQKQANNDPSLAKNNYGQAKHSPKMTQT